MDDLGILSSENESEAEDYDTESSVESLASSENLGEREGDFIDDVLDREGQEGNDLERAGGSESRGKAPKKYCTGVDGIKLFPPGLKASSDAWLHGGFKKDENGVLMKDKMFCKYCNLCLKFLNSPSNLMNHVREKHRDVNENEPNSNERQPKIFEFASSKSAKYKPGNIKQKNFRSNLLTWIVKDKRPYSIVEDKAFLKLLEDVDCKISVPNGKTISRDVNAVYKKKKKETKAEFEEIENFWCTTDGGTSLAGHSFIDINVHYIDKDFNQRKKIVGMKHCVSKKAVDYRAVVNNALEEHGIKEKTDGFTTDNENTMKASFHRKIRNGCIAHIMSKTSQKALNSSKTLQNFRKKLRVIAKKSNKSPKFKFNIKQEQLTRNLAVKTLKQEVATRFTATTTMIRSFLNDPNEGRDEVINAEKARENIEAINAAIEESDFSASDIEKLKIVESDLNVALTILPSLDIIQEGINLLGGENFATGSIVLPFVSKFLQLLENDEEDPYYFRKFK